MKKISTSALVLMIILVPGICQVEESLPDNTPGAFIKDGNVFVVLDDGTERQLTFTQSDEKPNLAGSGDQVIFLRNEMVVQGQKEYYRKKIMSVGVNDFVEKVISSQKPYKDGVNNTSEILRVDNPTMSSDGQFLFFLTNHTSESSQLIKLDINTGTWKLLFSAEDYILLNSGPFTDYFLIGRIEIGARGQGIYYYLVDQAGKKIKEFNSKESMIQFKNSIEQRP